MFCFGVIFDKFIFFFIIKVCVNLYDVEKGKVVYVFVIKSGYYGNDMFVRNIFLDMYLKCGELDYVC